MDKREKAERAKQEDAVLNKVLLWIVGAVVLEALLLLLNKFYVNYGIEQIPIAAGLHKALPVLALLFAAGCVGSVVWAVQSKQKGKEIRLPIALAAVAAALALCCAVIRLVPSVTGIRFLYVAVPVTAVLAMVYYLYQKEFFVVAALSAAGLAGLWLLQRREGHVALVYVCLIGLGVLLAACAVLARMLQAKRGILMVKGKEIRIFPENANYMMFYITCGLVAAVMVGGIVLGPQMLLYAVLVAWLLVMAVYYTVKLM